MNCAVDSPATQKSRIGGVYDRIHLQSCDVALYYGDHFQTILQVHESGEFRSNCPVREPGEESGVLFYQPEVRSTWAGVLYRNWSRRQVLQHLRDHEVAMKSCALVSLACVQCQH